MDIRFSIIIPVYNRPDEISELLETLIRQTYPYFEVVVVEDGSQISCEDAIAPYFNRLDLKYFSKANEGPGRTRNYGARKASGNYFIFFDSDCLIPAHYMQSVHDHLQRQWLDVFGGPDAAHPSFSTIQKAISYSMTSFFTTGGIRGGEKKVGVFHPRSFNMGFSKSVFEKTGGYSDMRFGEDLDMSMRIIAAGYQAGLIRDAFVYHKRRTDYRKFFKQVHNSGIARINLNKRHPGTLKVVHTAPALFVIFSILSLILLPFGVWEGIALVALYLLVIFVDALREYKSLAVAFQAIIATIVQHFGYGTGFLKAFWRRVVLGRPEFHAYSSNFYK